MHYYLLLCALFLWWMAIKLTAKQISLLVNGMTTEAKFVRWHRQTFSNTRSVYPIVSFKDQDEVEHEVTGNTGISANSPFEKTENFIDRTFRVRYLPSNPESAQISGFFHYWFAPIYFLFFGCASFVGFLGAGGWLKI